MYVRYCIELVLVKRIGLGSTVTKKLQVAESLEVSALDTRDLVSI